MRIATYNVNGVNGRLSVLLRWLKEEQPDIACLQELRAPQERFPQAEIAKLGYQAVWHGQKSWNGVAIITRNVTPVETRRALPGDPEDLHSRYIEAQIGDILVGCIYLPNGNPAPGPKFDYKLAWFRRLNAYARTLLKSARPVILCGDYNAVPTDLDAYKPERWVGDAVFFPETKDLYHRLIAQGWTDALRKMHPDEVIYTYWDYFRNAFGRNAGLRMDHILLSPALAPRLIAAGVDRQVRGWEKASDHAPTWIELKGVKTRQMPAQPRTIKRSPRHG
jgi:exodeoxyribonuclease-3